MNLYTIERRTILGKSTVVETLENTTERDAMMKFFEIDKGSKFGESLVLFQDGVMIQSSH